LEGADLTGAFLTNCPAPQCTPAIPAAASFVGAHLKNVSLAQADLSGADLTTASFYGSIALGPSTCTFGNGNCATAAGATMNNTQFSQAYLFGVDFTDTTVQGVQFGGAVLIAANFTGATLSVDTKVGTNSGFQNAFLQGTQLGSATLTDTSFTNAYVDFTPGGNDMFLELSDVYASFPGWHAPGRPICAFVIYAAPTTVPTTNTTLTCANGYPADPANGCGPANAAPPLNPNWNSKLALGRNSNPPASYLKAATYTAAAPQVCPAFDTKW
jgi:hypothetical protein